MTDEEINLTISKILAVPSTCWDYQLPIPSFSYHLLDYCNNHEYSEDIFRFCKKLGLEYELDDEITDHRCMNWEWGYRELTPRMIAVSFLKMMGFYDG